MPRATRLAFGLLLCLLAGCFPVDLDVNDKGEVLVAREEGFFLFNPQTRKTAVVAGPGGGSPVFARFAPGGKDALLVVKTGREQFRFDLAPIAGGAAKTIYQGDNTAFTLFSPDGKFLAIARVTEKKRPDDPGSKIPELILLEPGKDTRSILLDDVLVAFRWFKDSERLLVFKIQSVGKNNTITGELIELNVKTRKQTPLVAAITTQHFCLDLSPGNQKVLFTAMAAGKAGEAPEMPKENFPSTKLYEWNAGDKSVRVFHDKAQFARYAPSGKRVLLAHQSLLQDGQFLVADAAGKEVGTVATDGVLSAVTDLTLPGWLDEDTIYYFADRSVYGSGGKSFSLMTAAADGKGSRNAQPALDKAVLQLAKDLPSATAPAAPTAAPTAPPEEANGVRPTTQPPGDDRAAPAIARPPQIGTGRSWWIWPAAITGSVVLVGLVGGLIALLTRRAG